MNIPIFLFLSTEGVQLLRFFLVENRDSFMLYHNRWRPDGKKNQPFYYTNSIKYSDHSSSMVNRPIWVMNVIFR